MDSTRTLLPSSVHLVTDFLLLPEMPDSLFSTPEFPKCLINIVGSPVTVHTDGFLLHVFFYLSLEGFLWHGAGRNAGELVCSKTGSS